MDDDGGDDDNTIMIKYFIKRGAIMERVLLKDVGKYLDKQLIVKPQFPINL
jgi:hypothetical protein